MRSRRVRPTFPDVGGLCGASRFQRNASCARKAHIGGVRSVPTSVPKPTRSLPQISIADDIITIEHAASLVAAQVHRHTFGNARADHVQNRGSTEVVRDAARAAGGDPGAALHVVEAAGGDRMPDAVSSTLSMPPVLTKRGGESVNVATGRAGPRFDKMAAVAAATPAAEPPIMNVRRVMTMASKTARRSCR